MKAVEAAASSPIAWAIQGVVQPDAGPMPRPTKVAMFDTQSATRSKRPPERLNRPLRRAELPVRAVQRHDTRNPAPTASRLLPQAKHDAAPGPVASRSPVRASELIGVPASWPTSGRMVRCKMVW